MMAANRVGKTEGGAFELTCHLTGLYPHWWVGRRFAEAGAWWVAGDTGETTRNILQAALWGPPEAPRTGMLPAHLIHHKSGSETVGIDTVWVTHETGKLASVAFKSYDQGRRSFQGTSKQGIWLDEEAPSTVRAECLLRLMTTDGILLQTFTPLNGLTPGIVEYLEDAVLDTGDALVGAKGGVFGDVPAAV
jgi:phage terminase large subunit-like protein